MTAAIPPAPKRVADFVTALVLLASLLSLVWMVARASNAVPGPTDTGEILAVGGIWVVLFMLVSIVGYNSTRRAEELLNRTDGGFDNSGSNNSKS